MPPLESQDDPSKKLNRGEKKCRKALMKLGMKQMTGINRVTLKKRDGLIFVINDPEVLKNSANDNSYAIFGELKLEDPNNKFSAAAANKFKEGEAPKNIPGAGALKTEAAKEEDKKQDDS